MCKIGIEKSYILIKKAQILCFFEIAVKMLKKSFKRLLGSNDSYVYFF